eukprot:GEZU01042378.1.p1 GENE.GEZU01042378.1~~GEZU01042378.1.p1  ORF type:complete len:372 (-),score=29.17 GEZU01042378.1:212-1246(-)
MASDLLNLIKQVASGLDESFRIRNDHDAVVIALHCIMLQDGFRCVGVGEQGPPIELERTRMAPGWNASTEAYSFRYKHHQSSMMFLVKALTLGDTLLVHAMPIETKKTFSIEFDISKYVNPGRFANLDEFFKDLNGLYTLFLQGICRKLVPKEGYEVPQQQQQTSAQQNRPPQEQPRTQPQRPYIPPQRPYHDDPLRIGPVYGGGGFGGFGIGDQDLYPAGIPGLGPRAPGLPGAGGGMYVGPRHPGFGPGVNDPFYGGNTGGTMPGMPPRFGGPTLPPGAVPPGARFDPFGPPGVGPTPTPGPLPQRPQGPPGGAPQPRPPNGRASPDRDEFLPPGDESPYWM